MNIFESERLMSIRRSNRADKLIRVYAPRGIEQCYRMYSHGRNYSLYAYVPARQVYDLTVMNLVVTLVMYILILAFVQGFRWNSAKDFFMQQENSEQEYKKSLEQKNAALELAVQRETKANLAKREFLFNMSHDIRTPMNAIIGFTALAQTHIDDRDQVEDYLKKISVSSQHLLSLINDVLDMSRIENGKVTLETKPVHLPELVEDIGDAIQVGADKKHISFTVDTAGMKNEDVIADPLRLEQNCDYFGVPKEGDLYSEMLYIGFYTDKGNADKSTLTLLSTLKNKKIFLFGTAGFGGSEAYFQKILNHVKQSIDSSNSVVGEYMCQGKMPPSVRERYMKMKVQPEHPENIDALIENFDRALSHPDGNDLERLRKIIVR